MSGPARVAVVPPSQSSTRRQRSSKECVGLSVLRIAVLEPPAKLGVVLLPLVATITEGVIAQIEQPPPARGAVCRRAMRRVTAEDRDVAGSQLEHNSRRQIDHLVR